MNRFTYIILSLVVALSLTAMAQVVDKNSNINKLDNKLYYDLQSHDNLVYPDLNRDLKSDHTQAVTFKNVKFSQQWANQQLFQRTTPFIYDPGSGFLFISGINMVYISKTLEREQGEIYYSKNIGSTWDTLKAFNEGSYALRYPSISIYNPNNSKNINEMRIAMIGGFATPDSDPKKNWQHQGGLGFSIWDGNTFTPGSIDAPETNNPGNDYVWNPMPLASNKNIPNCYSAVGLTVKSDPPNSKRGAFGFLSLEVENQVINSGLPPEWSVSKFRDAQIKSTSYSAPIDITIDDNGNIYAATLALFADEPDNRILAITKSTDKGESWSEFEKMSNNILDQYAISQGHERAYHNYASFTQLQLYQNKNGFVAFGKDNFSYFFPIYLVSSDTIRRADIIEVKYNSGSWSVLKVKELNNMNMNWVFRATSREHPDNNNGLLILQQTFLGFEIQASLTADGQHVIVKYIDQGLNAQGIKKVSQFPNPIPITIYDNDTKSEVDELLPNINIDDIYIGARKINSSIWQVQNVTQDNINYKGTWIPNIVPSLNQIPILWATSGVYGTGDPFNSLPQAMRDKVYSAGCDFQFGIGGLSNLPVEENTTTLNFKLNDVYPNPVTTVETTQFTWEMNKAQNIKLELYNSVGQLMEVLYDNFSMPGLQGFEKDLSKYPSGSYLYVLTTESGKLAKTLNILN